MHWFLEHNVNHLRSRRPRLPNKIPSGSVIIVIVRPEIPHLLRDNLTLPLALLLVFLNPLVLINAIHKPTNTPYRLFGQEFYQSCSVGRPTLKVLIAMSSKSPSISLNISQYLFEYVFRVSPFRIDMDNRESKGRNPTIRNKMRPKHSSELLERVNRACTQTIKPPHCHKP